MARSVWPVAVMATAIGVVIAAYGASSRETAPIPSAVVKAPEPTPTPLPVFRVPRGMNAVDLELVHHWLDDNDDCRGSSDPKVIAHACPLRDAGEERLAAHGWCFDYPDKAASAGEWHRCSEVASIPAPPPVPPADSARLARWWAAAEPMALAVGKAQAMTQCGMDNGDAAMGLNSAMEYTLHESPPLGLVFYRMSPQDRQEGNRRLYQTARDEFGRLGGSTDKCRALRLAEWGEP